MKIATFNINNINKRLGCLATWLEAAHPDVVCLQELKCEQAKFPAGALCDLGYQAVWKGQRIEAAVRGVLVACIYLPNGNPQLGPKFDYKLAWFDRLIAHSARLERRKCRRCSPATSTWCRRISTSIRRPPTTTTRCNRRRALPFYGCSNRDGRKGSASCIPRSRNTPTGITCGTGGSAMRACGSTSCC